MQQRAYRKERRNLCKRRNVLEQIRNLKDQHKKVVVKCKKKSQWLELKVYLLFIQYLLHIYFKIMQLSYFGLRKALIVHYITREENGINSLKYKNKCSRPADKKLPTAGCGMLRKINFPLILHVGKRTYCKHALGPDKFY